MLPSWLLERTPARLSLVLAIGVVVQLTPLAGPLLLSDDAHSYAAYGRIDAALGGNPYTDPPAAFPSDSVAKSVAGGWRDTPSVYGPLFAGLSIGVAWAAGNNPSTASRVYRAIAAVSMLTLMGLAALISRRPDRAAAFVGWNPLLAVHFAGGGHNDATMMVFVLGALALAQREHRRAGAAFWAAAAAVKWVPAVFYALWALAARRRGQRTGLASFIGAAVALASVATWRYGLEWTRVITPLARAVDVQTRYSIVRRLDSAGLPPAVAVVLVGAAVVTATGLLVRSALTGRARLGLAACLLVAASPWLLPWYTVWPVALTAIERDRAPRLTALVLTTYLLSARVIV